MTRPFFPGRMRAAERMPHEGNRALSVHAGQRPFL